SQTQLRQEYKKRIKDVWHQHSERELRALLRRKFDPAHNPRLCHVLLATGDAPLHEVGKPSHWTQAGDDRMGALLMEVRAELQRAVELTVTADTLVADDDDDKEEEEEEEEDEEDEEEEDEDEDEEDGQIHVKD